MAITSKLSLLVLVFTVFLVSATLSLAYEREDPRQDPELLQCKHQCRAQQQFSEKEQRQCEKKCDEYHRQKQSRRGEQGDDEVFSIDLNRDPQRKYQKCQEKCSKRPSEQQGECQRRCDEKYREQQEGGEDDRESEQGQGTHEGQSGKGEQNENPYLFRQERFSGHITSREGNIRVLERFTKKSDLLQGIDNYRIAVLEQNPSTFMVPNHWDADAICVVLSGRGAITLLQEDNKVTHNLKQGDVFRKRAGTTIYKVNTDNNEKLFVLELEVPVNTPGQFEGFFGTGGRNEESFFRAFSDEILQAAFNSPVEQLRRLFEGQNKEVFIKASQEQIRALSQSSSSEEQLPWPFHRGGHESESQSGRPRNLFSQRPTQSNRYGKLYDMTPNDCKDLQELDLAVSFINITKGAMIGPFYNSRATKIAMVVSGNGRYQMACPHLSKKGRQERGGSTSYQRVNGKLSRGDVFVVPAGHPVVTIASNEQNLQVVGFEINAKNNQRFPLAGNNNILKQLEDAAKELSFDIPSRQVDEILNRQEEQWFFPGPQQRQQHGGGGGHASE